ncbi:MAG: SRPBCC domain-containing protein [Caulobacter sp.]|nr:SRPBCC domain-containing protein [Caulobacter sp.]
MKRLAVLAAGAALLGAGPAMAEVKSTWKAGLRLENKVTIAAPPDKVYATLGDIGKWWDGAHSYSGDAANMTIALEPGACFCETFPTGGGVKHGEVVLAWPGRMLRIHGAFGPLQDDGPSGALTFTLKAVEGGTEVVQTYNLGGLRPEMVAAAPVFDRVIGGQLTRFKRYVETGQP